MKAEALTCHSGLNSSKGSLRKGLIYFGLKKTTHGPRLTWQQTKLLAGRDLL